MRWRVLGSHYENEGISSWQNVIFSKAIQLEFSVAFSQQFRCIKRSDFFFSMFFFYKQELDYKLFKRMNEVKLSCVLLGNCLKEGGREVKHWNSIKKIVSSIFSISWSWLAHYYARWGNLFSGSLTIHLITDAYEMLHESELLWFFIQMHNWLVVWQHCASGPCICQDFSSYIQSGVSRIWDLG